ncbi:unnamed protein product [Polarella glacialis]|uniref:Uncharacterized protein n=1 Tax=Polarella glacialis TaxID=89957 RepID=A0A813DF66_POLGL|nr:unnamed protein product [Polarella glacialis]
MLYLLLDAVLGSFSACSGNESSSDFVPPGAAPPDRKRRFPGRPRPTSAGSSQSQLRMAEARQSQELRPSSASAASGGFERRPASAGALRTRTASGETWLGVTEPPPPQGDQGHRRRTSIVRGPDLEYLGGKSRLKAFRRQTGVRSMGDGRGQPPQAVSAAITTLSSNLPVQQRQALPQAAVKDQCVHVLLPQATLAHNCAQLMMIPEQGERGLHLQQRPPCLQCQQRPAICQQPGPQDRGGLHMDNLRFTLSASSQSL